MTQKQQRMEDSAAISSLGLEEIVQITNRIGMEYVDARKSFERLSLLRPSVRAKIMLRLDDGSTSEAKLQRLAETDPEYLTHIECMCDARKKADQLRVRYDSYKNLFEAKRSQMSFKKAEMMLL